MADFNSTNQTKEPIVKSTIQGILQTVFGRSDRQIEVVKGAEPPQEKFAVGEALESRLSQVFQGYQDLAKDRLSKYRDYDKMDTASTECQTALDIYAEEASQKDAKTGLKVWIESEDENLAADLNQMLQRIKMEFKAYGIYRNLAKYGDCFLYLMSGAYGIHDIQFVHPSRIERVQEDGLLGFKSPDLASILLPESKTQMFKPWEFLHQRIYAFDQETVYGRSFLESVRKVYKELSMLECYDETTEVLTREKGFVLFKDITGDETFATRNPDTKAFEWQKATEVVRQQHDGEMIELKSRSVDLLVTPGHRILLSGLPNCVKGPVERQANNEVVVQAKDLLNHTNKTIGIPVTSNWIDGVEIPEKVFSNIPNEVTSMRGNKTMHFTTKGTPGRVISGDDYCALMGMYLSEGCINKKRGIKIAQQVGSKGYASFKETLKRINGGVDVVYDGHYFNLAWGALNSHFEQFGYASDKFIPDDIMNAPVRQLRIFFDNFVLGDGYITKYPTKTESKNYDSRVSITTTSKRMAGQFVELAQKLGWAASVNTRPAYSKYFPLRNKTYNCKESYLISLKYSKINSFVAKSTQYKGNVYCVKVPNTIVYVRRNGKSCWSGNTMIILYRISKAIQRNIFYVDVGQSSLPEVQNLVKDYTKFLKNKNQFIDPKTKDFKLEFDPATILQDIVWPVRPGSESRVEKLENQMTLDGLKDLEHFRERLRTGLNIPLDFLTGEQSGGWNSKESLMLQDARFSRKITKLQDAMREGIVRLCQIHVAIKDRKYISPQEFKVQLGTLSDTAERQREDIMLRKAQVIEILSNVSVTLSLNRWQWADYLFDQILPLPAALRAKLYTPDPALEIEFEKTQKMAAKGANTGALNKGIKPNKPPKKTTADNLNKGFRSFGYGSASKRVEDDVITGQELLEELKEALIEIPTEEMKSKKSKKFLEKLVTMESNVFGLDEKEIGHYIEVIKETAPETIQNFKKINSTEKWEKFNNLTESDYSTVKVDNDPLNALVKSIIL